MTDYNQAIIDQAVETIERRRIPATITRNSGVTWDVSVIISGDRKVFATPKLAKIYLENYVISDTLKVDSYTSGLVGQKNDEEIIKRRGRPKKADNDRTRSI